MDLFRFASPGDHAFGINPGYFSLDNGATDIYDWNNFATGNNGDLGDWGATNPYTPDSYNDNSNPGVINPVTSRDLALMDALGWNRASATAYTVGSGASSGGLVIYSGDSEIVQSGGTSSATTVLSGGSETVSSGGVDQNAIVASGGEQHVFGSAGGAVVKGGSQFVESTGVASGTVVSNGGTVVVSGPGWTSNVVVSTGASEEVLSGGFAIATTLGGGFMSVASGGTAIDPTIDGAHAELSLLAGAVVSGSITFATRGGKLQIFGSAMPSNVIAGFLYDDTIDLASIPFAAGGTVSMVSGGAAHDDELQITEGGQTYKLAFKHSENFIGQYFHLKGDGAGGTLITDTYTPGDTPGFEFTDTIGPTADGDTWNHVITAENDPSVIAYTNWTANVVPTSSYDLLIDGKRATIWDVDFYGNVDSADSLTLTSTGRLDIRGRGLQLGNGATNNGFALVNNGLVTIQNISLQISSGNIAGGGRIEITQPNASLYILGTVTVGRNQTIVLTNDVSTGGLAQISSNDSNVASTLINQGLIEGGGTIGQTNYGVAIDLTNDGTINATNDTNPLLLEGNFDPHSHLVNDGTLTASGAAGMQIDHFTLVNVGAAGAGTLSASNGSVLTLSDSKVEGGLITTDAKTGGTVQFGLGAAVETLDGKTVGAVTNTGNLVIGNGTIVTAFGSLINQATLSLLSNNHNPGLQIGLSGLVVSGGGKIVLGPAPVNYAGGIFGSDPNTETTL